LPRKSRLCYHQPLVDRNGNGVAAVGSPQFECRVLGVNGRRARSDT
jgi:hypothetical protein